MAVIYLNGKYCAQRITGVQRVAGNLVRELDALVQKSAHRWILLLPAGAEAPPLRHIEVRVLGKLHMPAHLWEQLVLPWAARGGLLVSLAGSAPLLARRQAVMLHDAAVFDHPEAYTPLFRGWYRMLFRRLARSRARLLTVSAFSATRLAAALGIPPSRLAVVAGSGDHLARVAPDAQALARLGLQGRRFLLAVASANPTKNLARLKAAFALVAARREAEPGLRLVVVGGRNERVFSGAVTAPDDPPGVVLTGPVDDATLKALYLAAVALVFPSLYEGFGLPPLEAMACGCPVAAARAASLPEVCGDAVLFFDPLSVPDMARALETLLDDASAGAGLRSAGAARAARMRWSDSGQALLQHLGEAASR